MATMHSSNPTTILLFSGKRKSGKDFITEQLQKRLQSRVSIIIRLSGPIKCEFALNHNLNKEELFSSSSYKEKYRKEMISWSEKIRSKDHGYFIRAALKMYNASDYPIWIVSDTRRRSDLNWFKENYPDKICFIRIMASEDARKSRGYVFTPNIDDAESECDLDLYDQWTFTFENESGSESKLEEFLGKLVKFCHEKSSLNGVACPMF